MNQLHFISFCKMKYSKQEVELWEKRNILSLYS